MPVYGSSISVKELVDRIIKHSGKSLNIEYDLSKPSIKTKLCLDSTRAKEILGWFPNVSLDDGIEKTISWYKKNSDYYGNKKCDGKCLKKKKFLK